MRRFEMLTAVATATALTFLAVQAGSQEPESENGEKIDRPVIIKDRPAEEEQKEEPILPGREALVKIQGAWASEQGACGALDAQGNAGLYLTDSLIRWQGTSCSIRDVEATSKAATIRASCVSGSGPVRRVFELEEQGNNALTLRFPADDGEDQQVSLKRCPAAPTGE